MCIRDRFAARLGRATGSRAKDILAAIKTGEAAARRDYRLELVVERLTQRQDEDGYQSKEMQRGVELEPIARAAYESLTGSVVRSTGFLQHDELMAGCSVDGDVDGFCGLVEIKCPKMATHFGYLQGGGVPSGHVPQMLHNLWITGATWCDFVSFDDRFPEHLQLFVMRFTPTVDQVNSYAEKVIEFLREVDRDEATARGMKR